MRVYESIVQRAFGRKNDFLEKEHAWPRFVVCRRCNRERGKVDGVPGRLANFVRTRKKARGALLHAGIRLVEPAVRMAL